MLNVLLYTNMQLPDNMQLLGSANVVCQHLSCDERVRQSWLCNASAGVMIFVIFLV